MRRRWAARAVGIPHLRDGRERLPVLVAGFSHHDTWDTLIPAVFGVSTAEFEAGWQAYLAGLGW